MKVYIAGPISNTKDYDKTFKKRELLLKSFGYEVLNPVEHIRRFVYIHGYQPDYAEILHLDIMALSECDGINMLPNWQNSAGARREYDYAVEHGIKIIQVKELSDKW